MTGWIDAFQGYIGEMIANASPLLQAIVVDGIIGGISSVMGFLPLVMVMYFLISLLVNKIAGYKARKSFFIIELPEYKIPSLLGTFKSMCIRRWAYIVKAAKIILFCNMAVNLMKTFTWTFQVAETADASILASVASPFAILLVPIVGVLSWELAAAAVTGFIAKENVVGTLAVFFVGLEKFIVAEENALIEGVAGTEVAAIFAITKVAALAYLTFNITYQNTENMKNYFLDASAL